MKWVYIGLGVMVAMMIVSLLNSNSMYTSHGDGVVIIHMGASHEK